MTGTIHLVDQLDRSSIDTPRANFVALERFTIGGESRTVLFAHPDSCVTFPPVRIGGTARLSFGLGLRQTCWDRLTSPVEFRIYRRRGWGWGRRQALFFFSLDPGREPGHHRWLDFDVDLPVRAGDTVQLTFETRVPRGGDPSYAWVGWSDPTIHGATPPTLLRRRASRAPHVIIVTSDALRADHLGCYGHPSIRTPHIDRLAAEGWQFEHARTPSPATIGAYAALMSGKYPARLGIHSEWGTLPTAEAELVGAFADAGYETVVASSEHDHLMQAVGVTPRFERVLPLLGRPDQDGAITTRRLLQWLASADDRPKFIWLQYFDSHPPTRVPQPEADAYQIPFDEGDSDDGRLAKIRGVESILEIERALPRLRRGLSDVPLAIRLEATARALEGGADRPDLAAHLPGLAAQYPDVDALRLPPERIAGFARQLQKGVVPEEIVSWLEALLPYLREIEAEILLPLQGLRSFDAARRQYWAQVGYIDRNVGALVAGLKACGSFDEATIVFTSPHGEALGEQGVVFHHHTLQEPCLRVPLIVKPAAGLAQTVPAVIGGAFSTLDLPATLLVAHGLRIPPSMDSVSRWGEISGRGRLESREVFSLGVYATQAAIIDGPWKLIHAFADHWITDRWNFVKGQSALYALDQTPLDENDRSGDEPQRAQAMQDRLLAWAGQSEQPSAAG